MDPTVQSTLARCRNFTESSIPAFECALDAQTQVFLFVFGLFFGGEGGVGWGGSLRNSGLRSFHAELTCCGQRAAVCSLEPFYLLLVPDCDCDELKAPTVRFVCSSATIIFIIIIISPSRTHARVHHSL